MLHTHFSSPSRVGLLRYLGGFDKVLFVCAVAVRRVVGVLAAAQPRRGVLLGDEPQGHEALGFCLVRTVTERLRRKRDGWLQVEIGK